MKIEINGIKFEDVSVDEALQLINKAKVVDGKQEIRAKRKYNKKPRRIPWTDEEKMFILENPNMTPKKLWASIGKRHTKGAVSWMKYKLLNKN